MATKKQLLSLTTNPYVDDVDVTIDGEAYRILRPDGLSLRRFSVLQPLVDRFEELMGAPNITDDERDELDSITGTICQQCLTLPPTASEAVGQAIDPAVVDRLPSENRLRVVMAFGGLSQLLRMLQRAPQDPTPQTTSPSTGAKRSRASSGSTRARRRGPG
jgi:hypothetical protein